MKPFFTGSAKWFSPYHGKAAPAGSTVSSVARTLGWSETVWDLSGAVPVLNNINEIKKYEKH
jgi:hypothetical protein